MIQPNCPWVRTQLRLRCPGIKIFLLISGVAEVALTSLRHESAMKQNSVDVHVLHLLCWFYATCTSVQFSAAMVVARVSHHKKFAQCKIKKRSHILASAVLASKYAALRQPISILDDC
jgi:hypothetical protein